MNNLLPVVASNQSAHFLVRLLVFLLLLFFIGWLFVEMFTFISLFQVDILRVPTPTLHVVE